MSTTKILEVVIPWDIRKGSKVTNGKEEYRFCTASKFRGKKEMATIMPIRNGRGCRPLTMKWESFSKRYRLLTTKDGDALVTNL